MSDPNGLSRRHFLKGVGAGAIVAGSIEALSSEARAAAAAEGPCVGPDAVSIKLKINGETRELKAEPRTTLLDALRNHLDLTGTKKVCDRATCGACTVLIDGKPAYSCTTLAIAAQGRAIETVESLVNGAELAPIQKAFVEHDGQQCGFCTPGFVMACEAVLRTNASPDRAAVLDGLGGNLCRCGTYVGVKQACMTAGAPAKGGRR